jgi:plasmid stability protein
MNMNTITLKNIPDDLYAQLKQSAQVNRRSVNSEIIFYIERAVRSRKADVEGFLSTARTLREKTASYSITDAEFSREKTDGRP